MLRIKRPAIGYGMSQAAIPTITGIKTHRTTSFTSSHQYVLAPLQRAATHVPSMQFSSAVPTPTKTAATTTTATHPLPPRVDAPLFDSVLIANRGEIACRVMRTAKRLGLRTIAVFSDADERSQHVQMADEAYRIGPAPSAESYLRADAILDVAVRSRAACVHPGYGFLSENFDFSRACAAAGIEFVGPPENAMRDMGSKSASKRIMTDAGVPVTPGYWGEEQTTTALSAHAESIGYPIMVKAVMGGGGKGMRVVRTRDELAPAVEACQREAAASFGDSRVLLERYLPTPRHVELQVFADKHGQAVYLFERDCSVQRRHQKVLEEAPAPHLSATTRAAMGDSAVAAALAVGYVGAGTVEFMLDPESGEYFFMEMNTRLQVEHPVTEMVLPGVDLVEWQFRVAAGQPLPMKQTDVAARLRGHAIEARVYAENPSNNFLPAAGTLRYLSMPKPSDNVRIDAGVRQGDTVTVFYDPMISKLIVRGETRADALRHMSAALADYAVVGLPNNIEFLRGVVSHPLFMEGGVNTSFLAKHLEECLPSTEEAHPNAMALAALALTVHEQQHAHASSAGTHSPWDAHTASLPGTPGLTTAMQRTYKFEDPHATPSSATTQKGKSAANTSSVCTVTQLSQPRNTSTNTTQRGGSYSLHIGQRATPFIVNNVSVSDVTAEGAQSSMIPGYQSATTGRVLPDATALAISATLNGMLIHATVIVVTDAATGNKEITVIPKATVNGKSQADNRRNAPTVLRLPQYRFAGSDKGGSNTAASSIITPMPGKVVKVLVTPGASVSAGQPLLILEAMKMEHVIKAPAGSNDMFTVATLPVTAGDFVEDGRVLVTFAPPNATGDKAKNTKSS